MKSKCLLHNPLSTHQKEEGLLIQTCDRPQSADTIVAIELLIV